MANLEGLTDAQLRTKLVEYGMPVMPITGTTRKIMIKKLRLLVDTQKKTNAKERRTMAKYSSDDDSDLERQNNQKRRATVAAGYTTQHTTRQQSLNSNGAISPPQKTIDNGTTTRRDKSRIVVEVRHVSNQDTSSDTEPEFDEIEQQQDDDEDSLEISLKNVSSLSEASAGSPPKQFTSTFRSSIQRPEPIIPTTRYSAFTATKTGADVRHRHTYGYLASDGEQHSDSTADVHTTSMATPYLSNFSKRLSLLTTTKGKSKLITRTDQKTNKNGSLNYCNPNGTGFFNRSKQKLLTYFKTTTTTTRSTTLNKSNVGASTVNKENKGNLVSIVLVTAVGVFFLVLLALYYGMHHGSNTNDIVGLSVPYCSSTTTRNCLSVQEAQGGIDLYKILKPKLIELAIGYQCDGDTGMAHAKQTKLYMTDNDIVDFIRDNYKVHDETVIVNDIDSFVLIAYRNQFLGVSILKVKAGGDDGDYTVMDDMANSNRQLESSSEEFVRAFAVLSPTLPWKCSFWQKVRALLKIVLSIFGVAGVIYAGQMAYRWIRFYQHQRKEQIVMLVEKIVELMQTQSDDEQFLVINHVRDMIIPIDSRKKMEYAWTQALKFIDENESRIRTEVQVVKGETYEVWRWIGGQNLSVNNTSAAASGGSKSWQGQAFEVQAGSVNSPPCSPTPCLKVRGMIDDADRNSNKTTIREAILAKCGAQCRVLHVAVDVNSKCVYLKCADTNDAAVAYRNLHGQWFAGHLVTVKYLRLERYMQRFPDSPQSGPPYLRAI